MKFFKHYKNKPYKYLGIAKHSETLEDLVLYETRYTNDLGKIWVRPKEMFFENIQKDGQNVPRFQGLPIKIRAVTTLDDSHLKLCHSLVLQCLDICDYEVFKSRLQNAKKTLILIAYIEDRPVGFKLGYEENESTFYSWLGGVLPEFRGLGVALELMTAQHAWCIEHSYKKVLTKTKNLYKDMILLNIKNGFEIISANQIENGEIKITMQKIL